jgi:hypothetical protein
MVYISSTRGSRGELKLFENQIPKQLLLFALYGGFIKHSLERFISNHSDSPLQRAFP